MLDLDHALKLVLDRAQPKPPVVESGSSILGRVLAEDAISDIDSPPHDKALMDGYAIIASDLNSDGEAVLDVIEEVRAGDVPRHRLSSGQAVRIMTGAPIPAGADAVVMIEHCEPISDSSTERVRVREQKSAPGMNILRRGQSLQKGKVVLSAGTVIRPIEAGLLAEIGRSQVRIHPRPTVAVLATGDELVSADVVPGPGMIRNSNGPMIVALAQQAGAMPVDLGVARDDEQELRDKVQRGLERDVLVLSGGVSMGVADLAPKVLRELGVQEVFHKVRLKPGKPLWFGVAPRGEDVTLVFGLPGNPVSSLVCFELFVRPALARLAGRQVQPLPLHNARLACEYLQRGDRSVFYPARVHGNGAELIAELLPWQGSADLRTLTEAQGLAFFPAGEKRYSPGDTVGVYLL